MKSKFEEQKNPNVSVDCVIFGFDVSGLQVLLLERAHRDNLSFEDDTMVLPGDLIQNDEDLDTAAQRILRELTGIKDIYLKQVGAFGSPDRLKKPKDQTWLKAIRLKPDVRVITIGYFSLIDINKYKLKPSSFAKAVQWTDVREVPTLGFDHNQILDKALRQLRSRVYTEPVGFELLPKNFSLHELLRLYESILDTKIDKRNFRRKILKLGFIKETDLFQEGVAHKPAQLYRFDKSSYEKAEAENLKFY